MLNNKNNSYPPLYKDFSIHKKKPLCRPLLVRDPGESFLDFLAFLFEIRRGALFLQKECRIGRGSKRARRPCCWWLRSHAGLWRNSRVGDGLLRKTQRGEKKKAKEQKEGGSEAGGVWIFFGEEKRIAEGKQEAGIIVFPARRGMSSFPSTHCFVFYWTMNMVASFAVDVKGHRVAFGWAFSLT